LPSRGKRGIAIFLNNTAIEAYKNTNEKALITSEGKSKYITSSWFILIKLSFKGIIKGGKGVFWKKKKNKVIIPITITLIYFPHKENKYNKMLDFILSQKHLTSTKNYLLIRQDSNTKVGIYDNSNIEEEGIWYKINSIGWFGERKCNDKGKQLLNMVNSFGWKINNTFFKHKTHAT